MKTGRYSIAQLLTSPEVEQIIIPELQRDYVWGRRNVKSLISSILDSYKQKEEHTLQIKDSRGNEIDGEIKDFLSEEYMRLRYNTKVGFIYAYHDRTLSSQYYLIDGQQRITTIFLVLLALYCRSEFTEQFRKLYFVNSIPKIDYKVREVAHNFLVDFIEYELTRKDPAKTFKESFKYYIEYDRDVTAQSIYTNYYEVIVPMLAAYEDVESLIYYVENYIEFNYFDTNISEQGEKLYLYMNSRGESLSVQERAKSIIVGRSSDKLNAGKQWEDWQNFFWRIKKQSDRNADRGFYEFLKWAVIMHMCKWSDTKIKETRNKEKSKSRTEEIEDYIRIEKDDSAKVVQTDWIFTYISENDNFSFDWLQQAEAGVECMYGLLQEDDFKKWNFDTLPWFSGCDETIEYVTLLGVLYYIISFRISKPSYKVSDWEKTNVLRVAMYLKNLKSEYTLRRNPDRAVIRSLDLIDWMAKNSITDIRLLGIHVKNVKEDFNDRFKYVLRIDDLRWGYYQLDWQDAQNINIHTDSVGRWESFFWRITNNQNFNRFLRGNHDFVIRILQKGVLSPEEILDLFTEKIYKFHDDDSLRKGLLEYGNISVDDGGGSNNIGPNWMRRLCLLASDSDDSYWDSFMNGKDSDRNAGIVWAYLLNNQSNTVDNTILKELGNSLEYMKQKYYLLSSGGNQRMRVILLEQKQASKTKARELCVQYLHMQIKDSWIWEHNFCVINFVPTMNGLDSSVEDKTIGYYIDLWYDWTETGGRWYCRIGHREHGLSNELIKEIQNKANKIGNVRCNWEISQTSHTSHTSLRTKNSIYEEELDEGYFQGSCSVKLFFDEIWALLTELNNDGILI